ncbi:MAG: bifunctional DNA-formamidopyrimidine glycosylase/DNA-(apurinic or apyrimidinic site) lyase [Sulfuricaulis sp.]|uniref:bifunctional DNA-formamidopyrimidine glycosylase/DNA-(apurinic or apyrimidinic site) lyase n=1 Tax=Sulfuricaulis sp. TaxID=2003553 RepID=UPI0025EEF25F|nr:bifunctional DNA-formamidopyrimidine glycosylase/DNA-(apurinic or apyrimidinic site) lyase [Sulfuricaulis sp.]MCR4346923.1 bifunctional DNA-formamidopyrimidine glycosylase/DNA-(apurinic or apyrimidinic site) lyase [Sulfuricaulis sp.]
MPELPEVETTRRGIEPHVVGRTVTRLVVRNPRLRWRVTEKLVRELSGQTIQAVGRRGKYLLLSTATGTAILHLGMSGSLRVVPSTQPADAHDHVDIVLDNGDCLRLHDPRRFGALLWTRDDPHKHKLLRDLGPEPLSPDFSGDRLFIKSRRRKRAIRDFLLDSQIVAGIGNIYANEALFRAGLRPTRAAGRISRTQYERLAAAIRETLNRALKAGGTTLRDFRHSDGKPGYFQLSLNVYGRDGESCRVCRAPVRTRKLGQRSVFFCPKCQA